jgi:hypothetical protein
LVLEPDDSADQLGAPAGRHAFLDLYSLTREGTFLKETLGDFDGVLVSDFYAAYDSVTCHQQKCLEKEPERRYSSAAALADDLGRYLNADPIPDRGAG